MAMTAPRMRYAVGSPIGLRPRQVTSAPGTSPRSISLLRIRPGIERDSTCPRFPTGRALSGFDRFTCSVLCVIFFRGDPLILWYEGDGQRVPAGVDFLEKPVAMRESLLGSPRLFGKNLLSSETQV